MRIRQVPLRRAELAASCNEASDPRGAVGDVWGTHLIKILPNMHGEVIAYSTHLGRHAVVCIDEME